MSPRAWDVVTDLFAAALERLPGDREAWVRYQTDDPDTVREVLSLLEAHTRPGLFDGLVGRQDALERQRELPPGTRIGAWELETELGRGGMGVVYRARRADGEYEQATALKILATGLPGAAGPARFKAERQILAELSHPAIARLLDGGVSPDGRPYFVMELVDGVRIDRYCDDHGLAAPARLGLFLAVCDGVQSAHDRLIVHRDLKPGNILVDAEGRPKLLDFGIAKSLGSDEAGQPGTLTRFGSRPLTPEYASPEQLRGDPITPASDVFQLGLLLYRLLTGRRPYERADANLARIGEVLAGLPEHLGEIAGEDLDRIVLRALSLDPAERHATAGELATELRRHLDGRPLRAAGEAHGVRRGIVAAATAIVGLGAVAVVGWRSDPESGGLPPSTFGPVVSNILWVDDDPENNVAQTRRLTDLGVEVETALSTGEALSRYDPERFQLVVSDMGRYEGVDGAYEARAGLDLLERLRMQNPDVHFAVCTSRRAVAEYGAEALEAGALATFTNCEDIVTMIGHPSERSPR